MPRRLESRGPRHLVLWSAAEGMSSWLHVVAEALQLCRHLNTSLVEPCVAPDGKLSCYGGIAPPRMLLRPPWLALGEIIDLRRLAAHFGVPVTPARTFWRDKVSCPPAKVLALSSTASLDGCTLSICRQG